MGFTLRIGSRPSRLALAQTEMVRGWICARVPGLRAEIVPIRTSGDRIMTPSLAEVGGKGLFVKELEQALVDRRADIAVHSMKDLPAVLAQGFRIVAVPEREDPRDALITGTGEELGGLRPGARLGTSSARRRFQALRLNGALEVVPLRGNVDTRLSRVASGQLDAAIIAMAGLKRLGRLAEVHYVALDEREFVPAAAQAALAIEALSQPPIACSAEIEQAVAALNDARSATETAAERAFLAEIGASCVTPVGVKGTLSGVTLSLNALLFSLDGARELGDEIREPAIPGNLEAAAAAGRTLGARMLARGARELLGHG